MLMSMQMPWAGRPESNAAVDAAGTVTVLVGLLGWGSPR